MDSEKGREPLIHHQPTSNSKENLWMVYLSTVVAVSGSYAFGSCAGYSSPTQDAIRRDINLSLPEYALFGSILTFGAMIGAITSGKIADFSGRKGALRVATGFCLAGWLAIYFSKEAWSLDIGRLATGYGMGVFSYVVPIFVAEITPKNLRGALTALNQVMICTGVSISFILGIVLSWRALALVGLIPCFVLLFGLCIIPESPRWLAKTGRREESEVALQKLRGKDADISNEITEIQDYLETLEKLPKANVLDLFQRRYIRSVTVILCFQILRELFLSLSPFYCQQVFGKFISHFFPLLIRFVCVCCFCMYLNVNQIGVGLMIFQQFGGINGVCFYVSNIFESAGVSSSVGVIIYACLQLVITVASAIFIDRAGRKPLILVSAVGLVVGCLLTAISFYLKANELSMKAVPALAVTGILVYIGSFSVGMGAVPWVVMSEIFPLNVKGVAGSLATLVNWFGAWAVSYTYNFLMAWSSYGTFILYAVVNASSILFVIFVVPETKGRSLEQIQAAINM